MHRLRSPMTIALLAAARARHRDSAETRAAPGCPAPKARVPSSCRPPRAAIRPRVARMCTPVLQIQARSHAPSRTWCGIPTPTTCGIATGSLSGNTSSPVARWPAWRCHRAFPASRCRPLRICAIAVEPRQAAGGAVLRLRRVGRLQLAVQRSLPSAASSSTATRSGGCCSDDSGRQARRGRRSPPVPSGHRAQVPWRSLETNLARASGMARSKALPGRGGDQAERLPGNSSSAPLSISFRRANVSCHSWASWLLKNDASGASR